MGMLGSEGAPSLGLFGLALALALPACTLERGDDRAAVRRPATGTGRLAGSSTTARALEDPFKVPKGAPEIVARVGGRAILVSDLERHLRELQAKTDATGVRPPPDRKEILRGALDGLIERELHVILAEELGVEPDETRVRAWLERVDQRTKSNPAFDAFLLRAGKGAEQRRRDAEDGVRLRMIEEKLRVMLEAKTATAARASYDVNAPGAIQRELSVRLEALRSTNPVVILLPDLAGG